MSRYGALPAPRRAPAERPRRPWRAIAASAGLCALALAGTRASRAPAVAPAVAPEAALATEALATAAAAATPSSPEPPFAYAEAVTLSFSSLNGAPHFGPFPRLWRTAIFPSDAGLPTFLPPSSPLVEALPAWTAPAGANVTLPFSERVNLVRVLGGWTTDGGYAPSEIDDFVQVSVGASAPLEYTWPRLWGRVDPIVNAGLEPAFVWDNVPWGFVQNLSAGVGTYGCVSGPADAQALALYSRFARDVAGSLALRYGRAQVASWQHRVGTEPNCVCHWKDGADAWLRM